ncbi:hypothetical protein FISHEDRAFT_60258 [Fistulina hepatica ATCC 64428]|uniref:Uncharacterized protein n=1 Tax=Fistulina hepatica ATCC 64428 TaxID=1128425 RepID=A0A0D7A766_9AGAR|nr:hypothetical protein FISHEDRAFT_60258 [Fistulina hepatica ATCC 64428]
MRSYLVLVFAVTAVLLAVVHAVPVTSKSSTKSAASSGGSASVPVAKVAAVHKGKLKHTKCPDKAKRGLLEPRSPAEEVKKMKDYMSTTAFKNEYAKLIPIFWSGTDGKQESVTWVADAVENQSGGKAITIQSLVALVAAEDCVDATGWTQNEWAEVGGEWAHKIEYADVPVYLGSAVRSESAWLTKELPALKNNAHVKTITKYDCSAAKTSPSECTKVEGNLKH